MKFYAVRKGEKVGIYTDWNECKKQVIGYKGAEYKAFTLEADAVAYIEKIDNIETIDDSLPYAYIDGSYSKSKCIYSYGGFISYNGNISIIQGTGDAADYIQYANITGEVRGAIEVIRQAIQRGIKEINLYYDYVGIKYWITGEWKCDNKLTTYYRDYYNKRKHLLKVHFIHVKGHTGNEGNEIADLLAKEVIGAKTTKKQAVMLENFKSKAQSIYT